MYTLNEFHNVMNTMFQLLLPHLISKWFLTILNLVQHSFLLLGCSKFCRCSFGINANHARSCALELYGRLLLGCRLIGSFWHIIHDFMAWYTIMYCFHTVIFNFAQSYHINLSSYVRFHQISVSHCIGRYVVPHVSVFSFVCIGMYTSPRLSSHFNV